MLRRLTIFVSIFAVLGFVVPELSPLSISSAYAQQAKPKRKNLLELLFGGGIRKQRAQQQQQRAKAKQAKRVKVKTGQRTTKRQRAASVAAAPQKPIIEKAEDAAKVLVIGDFMAAQLSKGLEQQFAANPGIIIVDGSVSLSGMVRDDVKNWPGDIAQMIDETKPIAVVALVGMNDRQLIRTGSARLDKLSEGWLTEYNARADALAKNIREKRVPMIWIGLPPVSKGRMNADYLKFNEIYRQTVESYGGIYVDVWDGFVDTEGRYVRSGPDINGQIVSLRRSDGINMTVSGRNKLAFFAEKAVKRVTGFGRDALVSSLTGQSDFNTSSEPQYDPIGSGKTIVIALGGPGADGGSILEGDEGFLTASDASQSSSFELVARGVAMQPKSGRVDAGWGKPAFDIGREETPEPVLANIRGVQFKPFLDGLTPLPESSVSAGEQGAEAPAAQSN